MRQFVRLLVVFGTVVALLLGAGYANSRLPEPISKRTFVLFVALGLCAVLFGFFELWGKTGVAEASPRTTESDEPFPLSLEFDGQEPPDGTLPDSNHH